MKAKEIINWVVYFVCLLAVVFVINTFVVQMQRWSAEILCIRICTTRIS